MAVEQHFTTEESGSRAALGASGAPVLAEASIADRQTREAMQKNLFTRVGCFAPVSRWYKFHGADDDTAIFTQLDVAGGFEKIW